MSRCRVLVTGAGGFVGRALTEGFVRLGWSVIGLDMAFDDGPHLERSDPGEYDGVRRVRADLMLGVPEEVWEVDLVIHAAWVTTGPDALGISPAAYLAQNLRPLMSLLEYAARSRPAAFVFLSSSGVFSAADATDGLTDAHRPTGASPYAMAKRAGELLVPSALDPSTAPHIVRLGYLFGPGEAARPSRARPSPVGAWLAAGVEKRPLEVRADDPTRDWTFTLDLASALERVVDAGPAGRPVHLGSPHVWRDRAMAELIASMLGGRELVMVPPKGAIKPPMVPSALPVLDGFLWTDPPSGLRSLITSEVPA